MRRRGLAILLTFLFLLVLLMGGGLLYIRTHGAREQVRALVERELARALSIPVRLEGVSLSLGLGSVTLHGLTVADPTGGLLRVQADRLNVGLKLTSLLFGDLQVRSLAIYGPQLSVEDTHHTRSILAGALAGTRGPSRDRESTGGFPVTIERGQVLYRSPATRFTIQVDGLRGSFSRLTDGRLEVAVTADALQAGRDASGVGEVRVEARGRVGGESVEVERIKLTRGDSWLTFAGVLPLPGGPRGAKLTTTGELALGELAPLLGLGRGAGGSGTLSVSGNLFGEDGPRAFEGDLGIVDGQRRASGRLEASFRREIIEYKILEGKAVGGRFEGRGTARRKLDRWRHGVVFKLEGVQMDLVYDQLRSERRWASGKLFTQGSLNLKTAPGQPALPTLQGRLAVKLEGGSLSRYPALVRIVGLLSPATRLHRLPDLTREQMPYRVMSSDFTVTDGVLDTKNLLLDSDVLRLSGMGKVRLEDQIVDLDLAVRPLQAVERGVQRIPLLGRVLPQEQSLVVTYFRVKGDWADPQVSIAPVKSLSKTAVDILLLPLRAPERVISPER